MSNPLMKFSEVIALTTLSRSTIYNRLTAGDFPECIRLSPRRVVWRRTDIDDWVDAQAA